MNGAQICKAENMVIFSSGNRIVLFHCTSVLSNVSICVEQPVKHMLRIFMDDNQGDTTSDGFRSLFKGEDCFTAEERPVPCKTSGLEMQQNQPQSASSGPISAKPLQAAVFRFFRV